MYNPESEKFYPPTENPPTYHEVPSQQPPQVYYPAGGNTTTVILAQPILGQHQQNNSKVHFCTLGVTQAVVFGQTPLGQNGQRLICQFCQADVTTRTTHTTGVFTHLIAVCLCIFGCCPCCLLPYCIDDCRDVEHTCPNCERFIGHYKRI